jgi:GLPGLI family protein
MKKINMLTSLLLLLVSTSRISAQKVITDGSILYNVSVINGKDQPGIADAFDGATLAVWMKGNQVRTDLKSNVRLQTVFYNAKEKSAVILKESGNEKYMMSLTPAQWDQYNRKSAGIQFDYQNDTKEIAGYNCKKATGTLKDGSTVTVYYTDDLKPYAPGYEYAFTNLAGLPLEYEVTTGNIVVQYRASSVQTNPVSASKFDLPKAGYKLLEYKQ